MRTYLDNVRLFGHRPALLIADDSSSASAWPLCEQTLRRIADDAGVTLWYLGRAQRVLFAGALTADGDLPPDIVRFALFGDGEAAETIGANRNTILLATLGALVLSVDDDTIGEPATTPDTVDAPPDFSASGGPGEVRIFADRVAALSYVSRQDVDILAAHEQLLGRRASEVMGEAAAPRTDGHIAITLNGLAGDCGTHDNMWIRVGDAPGHRQRLASRPAYEAALASREIVRQVTAPTVSPLRPWVSTFFGFDNQILLPPFFPAYRNDEGIFGAILSECLEHRYAGHLPWTLVHAPATPRRYAACTALSSIRLSDIVLLCLSSWNGRRPGQPADAILCAVGQQLIDIASQTPPDFEQSLRRLLRQRATILIHGLERLRARLIAEDRRYWADDLALQTAAFARALARPDYALPVDLLASGPAIDVPRRTRALVRQFGALLTWWPAIVERARALARAGRTAGVRIRSDRCSTGTASSV